MSVVTNYILTFPLPSEPLLRDLFGRINAAIDEANGGRYGKPLCPIDGFGFNDDTRPYGGNKAIEAIVAVGSQNAFPLGQFMENIMKIDWDGELENVRFFVQEQDDQFFSERFVNFSAGRDYP